MKTRPVDSYLLCDVYQVEVDENTGKKVIHIDGYCYFDDENYQIVQGVACYMDIDGKNCKDKAELLFSLAHQYQGTATLEDVENYYMKCKRLPYENVTQDTPVGFYVNI